MTKYRSAKNNNKSLTSSTNNQLQEKPVHWSYKLIIYDALII